VTRSSLAPLAGHKNRRVSRWSGPPLRVHLETHVLRYRFAERTVKLGAALGESLEVLDGVKPGELVVTTGSFFLRAEAGRPRSGG